MASISELISHARIQESLLQGYRRLFLSVEMGLFSVASLTVSLNAGSNVSMSRLVVFGSLAVLAILVWFWMRPIIRNRGESVHYWQALILRKECGPETMMPFDEKPFDGMVSFIRGEDDSICLTPEYQRISKKTNDPARSFLDRILVLVVVGAWIVLACVLAAQELGLTYGTIKSIFKCVYSAGAVCA